MKLCTGCDRILRDEAFHYKNKASGTRQSRCRECVNGAAGKRYSAKSPDEKKRERREVYRRNREKELAYQRERQEANRDAIRASKKKHRAKNYEVYRERDRRRNLAVKMAALEAYGGLCACCGETEPIFLTLDHVENDGARHRKETGAGSRFYYWLKKQGYPPIGLQVLCFNCNNGKRINRGVCPHQSV